MADTKISNLVEGTVVAHDDLFVIVDKSDTTMDPAGTDVKVQAKNIMKRPVNSQSGTSYTLVMADCISLLVMTNAAAIDLTIPLDATVDLPIGSEVVVLQGGAGKINFVPAGGSATLRTREIGSRAVLTKVGADAWYVNGDLEDI